VSLTPQFSNVIVQAHCFKKTIQRFATLQIEMPENNLIPVQEKMNRVISVFKKILIFFTITTVTAFLADSAYGHTTDGESISLLEHPHGHHLSTRWILLWDGASKKVLQ
jgi:hypothetical protein